MVEAYSICYRPFFVLCALALNNHPLPVLQDDAYDVLQEAEETTEGLRTQVRAPNHSHLLPHGCGTA